LRTFFSFGSLTGASTASLATGSFVAFCLRTFFSFGSLDSLMIASLATGSFVGFSDASPSKPEVDLSLTSKWVFFVNKEDVDGSDTSIQGLFLYIKTSDISADQREAEFQVFVSKIGMFVRENADVLGGDQNDQTEHSENSENLTKDKNGSGFNPLKNLRKPKEQANNPVVQDTASDDDWG
jgi:hypothetical protein